MISPMFFSLYIDDMVKMLRKLGVGFHILNTFVALIYIVDDMALLAPSRKALQMMIDLCYNYCSTFCLSFNAQKSKVMVFGKSSKDHLLPLFFNGSAIEYVHEWKYLGTTIGVGNHLNFVARPDLNSFFRATNSIINVLPGAHEHVLVTLLYTNCVPILTYACAVKE